VLALFANPYALGGMNISDDIQSLILTYQNIDWAQRAAAAAVFGGIPVTGRLPVTASSQFPVHTGYDTPQTRLHHTVPEAAGLRRENLAKIDSIALAGIDSMVYPGCQVLVAVKGYVIYNKSFGYHTYDRSRPVKNDDIYDLASLTKIAATTLAVMRLYEGKKLSLDDKLRDHFPELEGSDKAAFILRKIMAHETRFQAWIPFQKSLIRNGLYDTSFVRDYQSGSFPYRIAEKIYVRWDFPDTVVHRVINSKLRSQENYRYSDLGFILLMRLVERISGTPLDRFVDDNFYKQLNLRTLGYYPRDRFPLDRIVPSENDTAFRRQVLHGDVNDPVAALFGGLGGHAGLFANAGDVAVVMQMLLQGGSYGGLQYFTKETIAEFTKYQYANNRRGAGFDKPVRDRKGGPTSPQASDSSFGHSGFTGTYTWADPQYDLVYVFLSNRTYPYSDPNNLLRSGIRTRIQAAIYEALAERDKSSK
jgi:beta-N-acetylhexosaminidase